MSIQQLLLGVGASKKTYIEDVFSTYLYRGNQTAGHTITNGIDLSGKGGLVWIKSRGNAAQNELVDTVRGAGYLLKSDGTGGQGSSTSSELDQFNSDGFRLAYRSAGGNANNIDYASWSFRKAKGFFDIVTYTGNGSTQTISHSLGCLPGMIIFKKTSGSFGWYVYHTGTYQSTPWGKFLRLDNQDNRGDSSGLNSTAPTSSVITLGNNSFTNGDGDSYVAYIFAGGKTQTANSVDFNGSDQYLSLSNHADLDFGTGAYTIEFFIQIDSGDDGWIFFNADNDTGMRLRVNSSKINFNEQVSNADHEVTGSSVITDSRWHHIAICRGASGDKTKLYVDGNLDATGQANRNFDNDNTVWIGRRGTGGPYLEGHISNLRVVKGTAVYTSQFTPPAEPLTNISGTSLLCCNGSTATASTVTPGTISSSGSPGVTTSNIIFYDTAANKFGENGDQHVIRCGNYVGQSSLDVNVNIGGEAQWVLVKNITRSEVDWYILDSMRGMPADGAGNGLFLKSNSSDAESDMSDLINATSTGFTARSGAGYAVNYNGDHYVYMAIRFPDGYVGKPAEVGTDVFAMDTGNGSDTIPVFDSTFPVDWAIKKNPDGSGNWIASARQIQHKYLIPNTTGSQSNSTGYTFDSNVGIWKNEMNSSNQAWMWKRHKGFDVVAFQGTNAAGLRVPHSLNAVPEMIWLKNREASEYWPVYHKGLNGGTNPEQYYLRLNGDNAEADYNEIWNDTAPTAIDFTVGIQGASNGADKGMLAMLFASVDGISKLGYYSGQSGNLNLNLGFAARFILIKPTNNAGEWWVFDTLRGIVSGNDHRLYLTNHAGSTGDDWVDAHSDGITINNDKHQDILTTSSSDRFIYYAHA